MTPVVQVGRAYSQPIQRGMPTTRATMARSGAPLRDKIRASTTIASRKMSPIESQAWSMAQTSPGDQTRNGRAAAHFANLQPLLRAAECHWYSRLIEVKEMSALGLKAPGI